MQLSPTDLQTGWWRRPALCASLPAAEEHGLMMVPVQEQQSSSTCALSIAFHAALAIELTFVHSNTPHCLLCEVNAIWSFMLLAFLCGPLLSFAAPWPAVVQWWFVRPARRHPDQPLAALVYHFARPCELFSYLLPSRISYFTISCSSKCFSLQDNRLAPFALNLLVPVEHKCFFCCLLTIASPFLFFSLLFCCTTLAQHHWDVRQTFENWIIVGFSANSILMPFTCFIFFRKRLITDFLL